MRGRLLVSLALLLHAAPAGAERLMYGGRSEAFWTDNVFGTSQDALPDEVGRLAPWADVSDNEGRVTWGLRAAPTYEYYVDQSGLRGFDYDVGGRFGWYLGDRTTFTASDRFLRYHSVTAFNEQAAPGETIIPIGQRQLFTTNTINGSLDHRLGPLDRVSLSVSQNIYDFSDDNQPDHSYLGTYLTYDHTLSERASIGTRVSWAQQTTNRTDVPDDVTDYYNLAGTFSYTFSPTMQLGLSAGPTWIQNNSKGFVAPSVTTTQGVTIPDAAARRPFPLRQESDGFHFLDADSCPLVSGVRVSSPTCKSVQPALTDRQLQVFNLFTPSQILVPFLGSVPSIGGGNTTYFASATLSKQWERWNGTLSYTRSAGQSTTIATVSDVVSGTLNWQIARRWTADLSGSYELREQANQNFALVTELSNQRTVLPAYPSAASSSSVRFVELDSGSGISVMTLSMRLAYQLANHASVYVSSEYNEQSATGGASALPKATRFVVTVGLSFYSDPVNF